MMKKLLKSYSKHWTFPFVLFGACAVLMVLTGFDTNSVHYFQITDFDLLHKSYPILNGNQEVLIYNGIINLLIMNSLQLHASSLLPYKRCLYVGSGFDSGDTYLLGQFSKEAFN